jgi:hypothetical protein
MPGSTLLLFVLQPARTPQRTTAAERSFQRVVQAVGEAVLKTVRFGFDGAAAQAPIAKPVGIWEPTPSVAWAHTDIWQPARRCNPVPDWSPSEPSGQVELIS